MPPRRPKAAKAAILERTLAEAFPASFRHSGSNRSSPRAATDFDENGVYRYQLTLFPNQATAVCHGMSFFQDRDGTMESVDWKMMFKKKKSGKRSFPLSSKADPSGTGRTSRADPSGKRKDVPPRRTKSKESKGSRAKPNDPLLSLQRRGAERGTLRDGLPAHESPGARMPPPPHGNPMILPN